MAIRASSSTTVRLNFKLSTTNLKRMPYVSGAIEGCMLTYTTQGVTDLAGIASKVAFLCFTPEDRSDVLDVYTDPMHPAGSSFNQETGGLTVIVGTGFEVGLPASTTYWLTTVPTAADAGKYVHLAAGGQVKIGAALDTSGSDGGTTISYEFMVGVITRVENGVVYFLFNSNAVPIASLT